MYTVKTPRTYEKKSSVEQKSGLGEGLFLIKTHVHVTIIIKMAARDILGIVNGLKLVVNSCANHTANEISHCASNSSLRPIIGSLCQTCENAWKGKDYDIDKIEFPGFPDDSFGGFPVEQNWESYQNTIPLSPVNGNGPFTGNGPSGTHRQLHTWCHQRRYLSEVANSVPLNNPKDKKKNSLNGKYKITDNQQVI